MNNNYYDIIIVGAGLSGLYSAYIIKQMSPHINLLVLESNRRPYIGGRIGINEFYGADIVVGAGVGRKDTDALLINLLKELHVPYKPFTVDMDYSELIDRPINVKNYLMKLREDYRKYKNPPSTTFRKFAKAHLGDTLYKQFIVSAGYSDYEDEDVYEVLYHYQMDDNAPGWTGLSIPWNILVDKLCNKIGYHNIKTSSKVEQITRLRKNPCIFGLITDKEIEYYANKVIIATRINTTQRLLPDYDIYKQIHGQPFLYVYAKFNNKSAEIMKKYVPSYTIVPGPLQKMISMDATKGVYMIAYSDNKNAEFLKDTTANIPQNRTFYEKEVEKALNIPSGSLKIISLTSYYWPIGTHYYEPLNKKEFSNRREFIKKAQHPKRGILVVGEAVSRRQGWTEGALQSVHAALTVQWIENNIC